MNITIIGSGNVGGALAQQWIKAGHAVLIGANFPLSEKNKVLADKIGQDKFDSIENAAVKSQILVIATPPTAIFDLINKLGDVNGKVIIDATNSVSTYPDPYKTVYHCLSDKTNADVVKCFNTTGFENILNPVYNGEGIDMFMAGESDRAKETVKQLALDCGFAHCYDFGKSDKVELLEKFALSWINLAIRQGYSRNIAFRLVAR